MSNKQGRNNLCKCGSGRKYKFCHGKPQSISLEPKNIDQAVFISAFAESLHGRKFGQNKNNADALLIGYSVLHRRLGRCLSRALKSLSDYNERRKQEGWEASSKGSASDHLDDYLDCVYAAAELYEFYMSDVIAFLNLPNI